MAYADLQKRSDNGRHYYAANREKILAYGKDRYAKNRGQLRAASKARRTANPEKIRAAKKEYYRLNREKTLAACKEYRTANLEKVLAGEKAYRESNRKAIVARVTARRRSNPRVRLAHNLRVRVRDAMRGIGKKSARTLELLGCTIPEFHAHLQSQLRPGMTWENYGPVWHIDHRRPCASFDLLDPAQQRECFHYTNLQPLFAEENLKKGAK